MDKNTYEKTLHQFTGTEAYHASVMSDVVLTDGALWVSQHGLEQAVNTIAARQVEVRKANKAMKQFQVWGLKKVPSPTTGRAFEWELTGGTGAKGKKAVCTSRFAELPDFPLDAIQFYVEPSAEGQGVIMLTSER